MHQGRFSRWGNPPPDFHPRGLGCHQWSRGRLIVPVRQGRRQRSGNRLCCVATPNGTFNGVEKILMTMVNPSDGPPSAVVTGIEEQTCIVPTPDSHRWRACGNSTLRPHLGAVGLDAGVGGMDVYQRRRAGTTHTTGGTYASDPWNFTNQNYANQNGTVGDSIVDTIITAPASVAPNGNRTASVPDAGAGATYTWSADNAIVATGAGTHSINFTMGTVPPTRHGTVSTTTGCSKSNSFEVNAADPSEVPTLGPLGSALPAALLAFTGAIVVARRRRT
jgi:hypothetical protein